MGIIQTFNYDETSVFVEETIPSYFVCSSKFWRDRKRFHCSFGHFAFFRFQNNLNYAICVQRQPDCCSVAYSNEVDGVESGFQMINVDTSKSFFMLMAVLLELIAPSHFRQRERALFQTKWPASRYSIATTISSRWIRFVCAARSWTTEAEPMIWLWMRPSPTRRTDLSSYLSAQMMRTLDADFESPTSSLRANRLRLRVLQRKRQQKNSSRKSFN